MSADTADMALSRTQSLDAENETLDIDSDDEMDDDVFVTLAVAMPENSMPQPGVIIAHPLKQLLPEHLDPRLTIMDCGRMGLEVMLHPPGDLLPPGDLCQAGSKRRGGSRLPRRG